MIDGMHTGVVFGIPMKCCKIETHFLSEICAKLDLKMHGYITIASNVVICAERETVNKSEMSNFRIFFFFLTKRAALSVLQNLIWEETILLPLVSYLETLFFTECRQHS